MEKLKGFQKQFLKGLAHSMKPVIFIGQNGLTPSVIKAICDALAQHELIKLKFLDIKDKTEKLELVGSIEKEATAEMVGMIGHVALFFKQHPEIDKRKIVIPKR